MTIKKKQLIGIIKLINSLEANTDEYKFLGYAFLRNKIKAKKIIEENKEILEFINNEFKTKSKLDEKQYESDNVYKKLKDDEYSQHLNKSEKLNTFLDEEIDFDFYSVSMDSLKNEKFSSSLIENFIPYIINE